MAQDRDRIQEAHEAIDRRARQREAAALALQQLTPEAIEAERIRSLGLEQEQGDDPYPTTEDDLLTDEQLNQVIEDQIAAEDSESLQSRLNAALHPVLEQAATAEPEIIGIGRSVFQWMLVPSEEDETGYTLALLLQIDEQEPAGFEAEITKEQLQTWAKGKGLQGNRIEHVQFVQALFSNSLTLGMNETGNQLVHLLEQLMTLEQLTEPTRTSVGDDDPLPDYAPENAGEVPEG